MTTKIPVFKPFVPKAKSLLPYLKEIDNNCQYTNKGPLLSCFENRLKEHFGDKNLCIKSFNNGTTALTAALMAFDLPKNSFCMMPSWTFTATPASALQAGLVPFFVDVDLKDWCLTPEMAKFYLQKYPQIKSIVVVSPFGQPIDVKAWDNFYNKYGTPVLIDGAASFHKANFGFTPVMISLHATKIFGIGEGGILVSSSEKILNKASQIVHFGFDGSEKRESQIISFNGKQNEYMAALGLSALDSWQSTISNYQKIADYYLRKLSKFKFLNAQEGFGSKWLSTNLNVIFEKKSSDAFIEIFNKLNIDTKKWWSQGCHLQNAYRQFPKSDLKNTEILSDKILGLPFYIGLKKNDIDKIIECIKNNHL